MVSSAISTPPPRVLARLSNSTSLNLFPVIGSKVHPSPFPPVILTDRTSSTSKVCGSTRTSFTLPMMTGSTSAVTRPTVLPCPTLIVIPGGLITS